MSKQCFDKEKRVKRFSIRYIHYKKLYHKLFNDITDTIEIIESTNDILSKTHFDALKKLKQSQIEAEEMYLDMCDEADERRNVIKLENLQKRKTEE